MICRPTVSTRSRAFTLMEILLALAVAAIILAVISTVYFNALQLRNRTEQSYDDALPLQFALSVIKRDLLATMPPGGTLVGEFQTTPTTESSSSMNLFPSGQQVSPFIYTASGAIDESTPFADVQKVAYYLVDPTNNNAVGRDLIRVVSRNLLPANEEEATSQWLMGGIDSMDFQYYDGNSWINTWDSTTSSNLPRGIKLQMVLAPEKNRPNEYLQTPIEMVVPLLIQSVSTNTQTTGGGQ